MAEETRTDPVLLAEDDEHDVFFIRTAFERAEVLNPLVAVPDGQAAIEYLSGSGVYADRRQHPLPCLLVTDIKMPRTSGFELLTWLQAQPQYRDLPKLVISSSSQETDLKRSLDLGAKAFFQKPNDLKQLIGLVKQWKRCWLDTHPAQSCSTPT